MVNFMILEMRHHESKFERCMHFSLLDENELNLGPALDEESPNNVSS